MYSFLPQLSGIDIYTPMPALCHRYSRYKDANKLLIITRASSVIISCKLPVGSGCRGRALSETSPVMRFTAIRAGPTIIYVRMQKDS